MKRLVLIDGHAILHRAFHALPPTLTAPSGLSVNAIHGFMNMLLKVLADLKPDFLAVAFDLPTPTFRQQLYTQYQKKRPEMAGNLADQIPLIHELLDSLEIKYFEVASFEADDCLGTLAAQSPYETFIVTGDRDMLQLVTNHVKIFIPIKGLSETKTYDLKLMQVEFGVTPAQWIDVKALKGDSSDNYPGVAGIGPKTALELIKQYGTLENLYRHLGQLPERVAVKLAEGAENAGLGKKLATIVCDVPIHLRPEELEVAKINWPRGMEYMITKLGFKSLPQRIMTEILGQGQVKKVKAKKEVTLDPSEQMKLI